MKEEEGRVFVISSVAILIVLSSCEGLKKDGIGSGKTGSPVSPSKVLVWRTVSWKEGSQYSVSYN